MNNRLQGWDVYPGHIITAIEEHMNENLIRKYSNCEEIHDGGLIAYEVPIPENRVKIWNTIINIPWVSDHRNLKFGWSPGETAIDWLPVYFDYMPKGVEFKNTASFACQSDSLHFLIDIEDPGNFIQVVAQHIRDHRRDSNLKYFEDMVGEELRDDMKADRVRVWFRALRKRPSKEGWKGLEDTLVRWLKYSQETPPPVGGAKAINELKVVDMGEKKKGMYCELDLTDTRQETVEAMLAMVATYSETVFPLDYIFFA